MAKYNLLDMRILTGFETTRGTAVARSEAWPFKDGNLTTEDANTEIQEIRGNAQASRKLKDSVGWSMSVGMIVYENYFGLLMYLGLGEHDRTAVQNPTTAGASSTSTGAVAAEETSISLTDASGFTEGDWMYIDDTGKEEWVLIETIVGNDLTIKGYGGDLDGDGGFLYAHDSGVTCEEGAQTWKHELTQIEGALPYFTCEMDRREGKNSNTAWIAVGGQMTSISFNLPPKGAMEITGSWSGSKVTINQAPTSPVTYYNTDEFLKSGVDASGNPKMEFYFNNEDISALVNSALSISVSLGQAPEQATHRDGIYKPEQSANGPYKLSVSTSMKLPDDVTDKYRFLETFMGGEAQSDSVPSFENTYINIMGSLIGDSATLKHYLKFIYGKCMIGSYSVSSSAGSQSTMSVTFDSAWDETDGYAFKIEWQNTSYRG